MNNFLPDEYDIIPSNSRYIKLGDGENTIRVLSSAITGWLYWNNLGKPVRSKDAFLGTPADIRIDKEGKPEKVKHFWAFVVYNYDEKRIQILEATQSQIQNGIKALVDSKHWDDPKNYEISISRRLRIRHRVRRAGGSAERSNSVHHRRVRFAENQSSRALLGRGSVCSDPNKARQPCGG
jgi:hypothetical protein